MALTGTAPAAKDAAFSRAPKSSPDLPRRDRGADAPSVLLVAELYNLPYMVLRCAAEAGAKVVVFGGPQADGLRHSTRRDRFIAAAKPIAEHSDDELIGEINRIANELSIDLVIPGDTIATRRLAAISQPLGAPCFPTPALDTFDLLNDKWRFTQICHELDIPAPESRFFEAAAQLRDECRRDGLRFPFIVKPINQEASRGVIHVNNNRRTRRLDHISYSPIIFQSYIKGTDIGASVFCKNGEIEAFLTHHYNKGTYTAWDEPKIYEQIKKITQKFALNGVYNFDMRQTKCGEVFFLECNPRVFYKIALSMMAGINFIELGFPWRRGGEPLSLARPITVRLPQGLLLTPWKLDKGSRRGLKFVSEDPVPYLRERIGLERSR